MFEGLSALDEVRPVTLKPRIMLDVATAEPLETVRARTLHGDCQDMTISAAEKQLLQTFRAIRCAESDDEDFREWEAWKLLRLEVEARLDDPEYEVFALDRTAQPDLHTAADAMARWLKSIHGG